jgi:pimeloyl-ACP methyl ester carboxylesterase
LNPPVHPEDYTVHANGVRFHVRQWGREGQPVVLLHGLASSAQTWNLVAPLLARTYRVYAIDERGHGQSDQPDDGYDLPTFVADLTDVLASLSADNPVHNPILVGHSWGAHVALAFAAAYPDVPSRLVLVDGAFGDAQMREGWTWEVAEKQMAPPDIRMPLPAFVDRLRDRFGAAYSDDVRDAVLGNIWIDERGVIHPHLTREHHMLLARAIWEHRSSQDYPKVRCPTLLVPVEPPGPAGDPDRLRWKRRMVALADQRLPRSLVLWFRDTMHDVQLQRPSELATAIVQFAQSSHPAPHS